MFVYLCVGVFVTVSYNSCVPVLECLRVYAFVCLCICLCVCLCLCLLVSFVIDVTQQRLQSDSLLMQSSSAINRVFDMCR